MTIAFMNSPRRERSIGEIRDVMQRLSPGLMLNSLGNPLSAGTFRFDKGDSKAFLYKNLSGGEKAAFDLLLDLLIKRREFDDTVFFIDEPEAHMSPGLQSALFDELFRAVPDSRPRAPADRPLPEGRAVV
ncbi:MAG: AAA family ATPase [Candidatus Rokubacteria bacterium]|nr:AAA family ATPase [Candidatus Rokubacteria bacterium]